MVFGWRMRQLWYQSQLYLRLRIRTQCPMQRATQNHKPPSDQSLGKGIGDGSSGRRVGETTQFFHFLAALVANKPNRHEGQKEWPGRGT
jgi:hypothetical protein